MKGQFENHELRGSHFLPSLFKEGPDPSLLLIKECEGSLDVQGLPLHCSCVLAKDRDEARWPC